MENIDSLNLSQIDTIEIATKGTVKIVTDSLKTTATIADKQDSLLPSLLDLTVLLITFILLTILLLATICLIWYCCISSIYRPIERRTKWYHIPINDIGKYLLLKRCHDKYYGYKDNFRLTQEFRNSMFMEDLMSAFYANDTKSRVTKMLENKKLVKKYFSEERFGPQEFYSFFQEYKGDKEIEYVEVSKHLPQEMRDSNLCVKCFYWLINEGYLDSQCQPIRDEDWKVSDYYIMADTIWYFCKEHKNIFNRDKNFTILWGKNEFFRSTNFGSALRSGLSASDGVHKKKIQREIENIIKRALDNETYNQ